MATQPNQPTNPKIQVLAKTMVPKKSETAPAAPTKKITLGGSESKVDLKKKLVQDRLDSNDTSNLDSNIDLLPEGATIPTLQAKNPEPANLDVGLSEVVNLEPTDEEKSAPQKPQTKGNVATKGNGASSSTPPPVIPKPESTKPAALSSLDASHDVENFIASSLHRACETAKIEYDPAKVTVFKTEKLAKPVPLGQVATDTTTVPIYQIKLPETVTSEAIAKALQSVGFSSEALKSIKPDRDWHQWKMPTQLLADALEKKGWLKKEQIVKAFADSESLTTTLHKLAGNGLPAFEFANARVNDNEVTIRNIMPNAARSLLFDNGQKSQVAVKGHGQIIIDLPTRTTEVALSKANSEQRTK